MKRVITIIYSDPHRPCDIDIHMDGKSTDGLTYEEAVGLLAQILPCSRAAVNWLVTPEQQREREERYNRPPKTLPDVTPRTEPTVS